MGYVFKRLYRDRAQKTMYVVLLYEAAKRVQLWRWKAGYREVELILSTPYSTDDDRDTALRQVYKLAQTYSRGSVSGSATGPVEPMPIEPDDVALLKR